MMTAGLMNQGPDGARLAALLPEMDARYQRLHGLLDQAAAGADIQDWQLDLYCDDLATVLAIIAPADTDADA